MLLRKAEALQLRASSERISLFPQCLGVCIGEKAAKAYNVVMSCRPFAITSHGNEWKAMFQGAMINKVMLLLSKS